jgi:hypothetical protein
MVGAEAIRRGGRPGQVAEFGMDECSVTEKVGVVRLQTEGLPDCPPKLRPGLPVRTASRLGCRTLPPEPDGDAMPHQNRRELQPDCPAHIMNTRLVRVKVQGTI